LLALLFSVLLLSLWTSLGYALLRALDFTRNKLQSLLLAPPLGIVCTVLPVFFLSRMGVPCKTLALPLTLLLIAIAGIGLWWAHRRDRAPLIGSTARQSLLRRYAAFAVLILLALVLSGRPMFEFGFNWLSYCNEDMANYTMAAERFLHYGFFDIPPMDSLTEGRNYNQSFWFMHARDAQRPGCELIIAWLVRQSVLRVLRVHVNGARGDLRQQLVGLFLLVQRLGEQLSGFLVTQQLSERDGRTVAGDLVVLDLLLTDDQPGRYHLGVAVLFHHLLVLFEQAFHALAVMAGRFFAELLEDRLQAFDLALGLLNVFC
jgi:hypothetical protein